MTSTTANTNAIRNRSGRTPRSRRLRACVLLVAVALVAVACADDDSSSSSDDQASTTTAAAQVDHESIGLWDDGPCDESKPPLVLGLMTVFESPVLSLKDQATALEVSATAFNQRGGANGACIEVHTCDDGGNADQALGCVGDIDEAGVHATVNDQGTAGQADVSARMAELGIPRVASNVGPDDWGDQNAYPLTAAGTGGVLLLPQTLVAADVKEIGLIRVDLAAASAMAGLLEGLYADDGASFPFDAPVPAGTTDYSQFILGAQADGVGGVVVALGEQEAIQIVRAAQQLGSDLLVGAALGTFSQASVADLGDFGQQMRFLSSFPPASYDLPVYDALRADLAASGDEALQPENLKLSAMQSWIGLYALLEILRDAGTTDFSREGISELMKTATDVPMLDMFGGENWTPNLNHPGIYSRAGINHWQVWRWDPEQSANGIDGNFVPDAELNFDEVVCGSPIGAPC